MCLNTANSFLLNIHFSSNLIWHFRTLWGKIQRFSNLKGYITQFWDHVIRFYTFPLLWRLTSVYSHIQEAEEAEHQTYKFGTSKIKKEVVSNSCLYVDNDIIVASFLDFRLVCSNAVTSGRHRYFDLQGKQGTKNQD